MTDTTTFDAAVAKLAAARDRLMAGHYGGLPTASVAARDDVLARFQPILAPAHLPELTAAEVQSFLLFSNNQNWTGLHRQGPRIVADLPLLRSTLANLLDESRPIAARYDETMGRVRGLGRAIATAMLLVAYPDRYGVWNSTAEGALKTLELWPSFGRGESEGQRYLRLNTLYLDLCARLGVDLWTLDTL